MNSFQVILFIFFTFNNVLSKDCCQGGGDCLKLTTFNDCLGPETYNLCRWYCYIKPISGTDGEISTSVHGVVKGKYKNIFEPLPKPVFTKNMIKALKQNAVPSKYYETHIIATYDKTGNGKVYEFDPKFIQAAKTSETFALALVINYIKTIQTSAYDEAVQGQTKGSTPYLNAEKSICEAEALKFKGTNYNPKCIVAVRRRLLSLNSSNITKNNRRRLSVGAESDVADNTVLPYSATGLIILKKWNVEEGAWTYHPAVGAIFFSYKVDGVGVYDYILTAGHNIYNKDAPDKHKQYNSDIRFYRGLSSTDDYSDIFNNPTHTWAMVERIWVPLYKGDGTTYANDFAVIIYKRPADQAAAPYIMRDLTTIRASEMKLITYRQSKQDGTGLFPQPVKQRKIVEIQPENDMHGTLYTVDPEFTMKGTSGSPAVEAVATMEWLVGILVGSTDDTKDVLSRLGSTKTGIINKIFLGDYDKHAEIDRTGRAKTDYKDMMKRHYAHKNIHNQINQYVDNKQQSMPEIPVYSHYNYNNELNIPMLSLEIFSFMLTLLVFGVCTCLCGGIVSFVALKLYKVYQKI